MVGDVAPESLMAQREQSHKLQSVARPPEARGFPEEVTPVGPSVPDAARGNHGLGLTVGSSPHQPPLGSYAECPSGLGPARKGG